MDDYDDILCDQLKYFAGGLMAIDLALDETLLATAFALSGFGTKEETVDAALSEFIQRRRAPELIELFDTVDYDPSYDYKQLRQ